MHRLIRTGKDRVDAQLDKISSYRLVLYFLIALSGWGLILGILGQIPFSSLQIAKSIVVLLIVCWVSGLILSKILIVFRNRESDLITALILGLILSPASDIHDYLILAAAGAAAVASKYILTIGRRHIFNPAAMGAYLSGFLFHNYASWWVGTAALMPLVIFGGLLVLRKISRILMAVSFVGIYLLVLVISNYAGNSHAELYHIVWLGLSATPILFFASVMLGEPLTSPRLLRHCLVYILVVGLLYSVPSLHTAPEEALLVGNILAFAIAPSLKYKMKLLKKKKEAEGVYSFYFSTFRKLSYRPGQYLEWTLPEAGADSRGNRRYFTLSSSPTEEKCSITVRISDTRLSSFKRSLAKMPVGEYLLAGALDGSFILPKKTDDKLVFIAGGIGITPFRSIIKYLSDSRQPRDMRLIYITNLASQQAFKPLFRAARKIGLKTLYIADKDTSHTDGVLSSDLNRKVIESFVTDWQERLFYVSGPNSFVKHTVRILRQMGVKNSRIKSDYFPGYG